MRTAEPRSTWTPMAPAPGEMLAAACGPYTFEISRMPDNAGYVLQMWQLRPEDWPLVVWEMDGFSLAEAKDRAERLADERVPDIVG